MDPLDKAIRPDEVKEIVFDQGRVILSTHNSVRAYGFQEIRSADMMIVTREDPAGVREPVLRTIRIATNDGGSYDIPMGGVWNRPSWTNDTAGVAVAMEEIKQYIKKCCGSSGENEEEEPFIDPQHLTMDGLISAGTRVLMTAMTNGIIKGLRNVKISSGSTNITISINGVAISGLDSILVGPSVLNPLATANNIYTIGDEITLTTTAGSLPIGISLTIDCVRQ